MKKIFSSILAAIMISSCMAVPAFAYPSDIPGVGQQEYGNNGTTKINAYNTDARVYPTSQAPAMKNTKTINGVTFSEYIKHQESDITLENGEKAHIVSVYVGLDGAMHSSASDARFVFYSSGLTAPGRFDTMDNTYTTGERCNYVRGEKFRDLEYWKIKPFAEKKGTGGEYVGNLTWQFLRDEDRWALYEEELTYDYNGGYASYSKTYDITTFVNGVQTNFIVIVTTEGTPKGDNPAAPKPIKVSNLPKQAVANRTDSSIYVNGKKINLDVQEINGSNYFKLRDIAYVLNGTEKQFAVGWDNASKTISLTTNQPYAGEAPTFFPDYYYFGIGPTAKLTDSPILVNGAQKELYAYNITGSNFFKLRDLGQTFDFYVGWDSATQSVTIDTTRGYQ